MAPKAKAKTKAAHEAAKTRAAVKSQTRGKTTVESTKAKSTGKSGTETGRIVHTSPSPSPFVPVATRIVPTKLLARLGSIVVHVDEFLSAGSHPVDREEILQGLRDPDVRTWVRDMGALLPHKRSPGLLDGVEPPIPRVTPDQQREEARWKNAYTTVQVVQTTMQYGAEDSDEIVAEVSFSLVYKVAAPGSMRMERQLQASDENGARAEAAEIIGYGCTADDLKNHMKRV